MGQLFRRNIVDSKNATVGMRKMVNKICEKCGSHYSVRAYRKDTARFCSRSCQVSSQVWTKSRREKIGKATSGPRYAARGENHYYWKGGSWNVKKAMARERDKDSCQCTNVCGWHKGKKCGFSDSFIMHVDHIKPKKLFPTIALEIENMTTLCPNCHQYKTNQERRDKIFKKKK